MKRIQEFKQQFENSNTAYTIYDRSFKVLYANIMAKKNSVTIFDKEIESNMDMLDFVFLPDKEDFIQQSLSIFEGETKSIEKAIRDTKGIQHWFSYEYTPFTEGENILGVIFKAEEISEQRLRDKQVVLYKQIFNSIEDGICLLDPQGNRTWCNGKLCEFPDGEIVENCSEFLAKKLLLDDKPLELHSLLNKVDREGVWEGTLKQLQDKHKNNRIIHKKIIKMDDYILPNLEYIVITRDISEKEMYKQKSEENLGLDKITGKNNRSVLELMIEKRLSEKKDFALLNLDIDSFSGINKLKGYGFGDALLKEVAFRISDLLPDADVIRSHSDNFIIICNDIQLKTFLENYFVIDYFAFKGIKYAVSMGISRCPFNGYSSKELVLYAETAMIKAKEISTNSYQFYENDLDGSMERTMMIDEALRSKNYQEFLHMNYQSINLIDNNTVIGYEALIRWEDDELGRVSPVEFIPIAEKNGRILEITQFVLDQVTEDIEDNMVFLNDSIISVNISILDLMSEFFVENLKTRVEEKPWIRDKLELEITETSFVDNFDMFQKRIQDIREIGFEVAIDDFGTGFSSLDKLVSVRFDRLKIDRNFVSVIFNSKADYIVLETIIDLAKKLDMKITAEGVESFDQVLALKHLGISNMQGYYFSKPMTMHENLAWYNSEK